MAICMQAGAMMTMPKPDDASKERFRAMLPPDPRVKARPMFGNIAGFVNGNMFTGLYGDTIFLRLSEEDRVELLREQGARPFAPMAGRPMREYVVVPEAWQSAPERIESWLLRSLAWTASLPEKAPKTAKSTTAAKIGGDPKAAGARSAPRTSATTNAPKPNRKRG